MGLFISWLQLTLAPMLAIGWIKPNLLLISMVVAGLRWVEPWLFVYAVAMGLTMDVFSHGNLGIYGISFFLTSFLVRMVGTSIYEHNLLFNIMGVFVLSLVEGFISITIFEYMDTSVPWWAWLFQYVIPQAMYNGLLGPVFFIITHQMEQRLKWSST